MVDVCAILGSCEWLDTVLRRWPVLSEVSKWVVFLVIFLNFLFHFTTLFNLWFEWANKGKVK